MESITITFKHVTDQKVFRHKPRPGGSYSLRIKYEGAFAVVVDEWGTEYAYPAEEIFEIVCDSGVRY